jgi:hypothetical protein
MMMMMMMMMTQRMWNVRNKTDTSDDRGNWNHFRKIHKTLQQRTGETRSQVITKNSRTGHCTHTAGSANVTVQNVYRGQQHCM